MIICWLGYSGLTTLLDAIGQHHNRGRALKWLCLMNIIAQHAVSEDEDSCDVYVCSSRSGWRDGSDSPHVDDGRLAHDVVVGPIPVAAGSRNDGLVGNVGSESSGVDGTGFCIDLEWFVQIWYVGRYFDGDW